jgi:ABC-2 type transport system ATP-binding protein
MAIIETEGLSKTFKAHGRTGQRGGRGGPADSGGTGVGGQRGRTVEAVRGVNLLVREGEIYGFLGPNGAGKTTTMRMLATLLTPSGGRATVTGHDLRHESAKVRCNIGYVGQAGGASAGATGRENVRLQARLYGMTRAKAEQRTAELLAALDLEPFADRLVKTYSGGQRRRLDLAMGMVHRPALLFLDEPTTGLDPQSRARLWDEVRALHAAGATVFLTTHYLEEADALCDRLAIINDGYIAAEDVPDALKRRIAGDLISLGLDMHGDAVTRVRATLSREAFVRELRETTGGVQVTVEQGETVLPIVLRLLDDAGVSIRTISLARPTLDDVFLRLTGRSLRESAELAA